MTIVGSFASMRCRAPPPPGRRIVLRVLNTHLRRVDVFSISVHISLKKLMNRYCQMRNLDYDTVRFVYNGRHLRSRKSPADLMMEDSDVIDVFIMPRASFASERCKAPPSPGRKIILRVLNTHLRTMDVFSMSVHKSLKKLMNCYCQKGNLDYDTVRFVYNGTHLRSRHSPADLMMEDSDVIDVFIMPRGPGPNAAA